MTEPSTIPLNKLTAWAGNVRKTDPAKGLDELAASIAAHGLLQSLVVRQPKRGKPAVVAGRRRLMALQRPAEAGTIAADYPVPCQIIGHGVDAAEISLVENTLREPMHPADEFEAFRDLADGGLPVADIAARFGFTSTVVEKRLKLARVSPAIFAAFREGELTLEAVMAFASVEDHAAQEQVLDNLRGGWSGDADDIRYTLTADEIAATDKRVRFVTLEAYEAAGGGVRRDLFADDESGIKILDAILLDRLVTDKLQSSTEALRAEGWSWIELRVDYDWSEWKDCKRCHPESPPLPDDQQAELTRLVQEHERLWHDDIDDNDTVDRLEALEKRIAELEDREEFFSPQSLANAGAVVSIGHDGELEIRRGLVRPEDAAKAFRKAESDDEPASEASSTSAMPAKLVTHLTSQKSAALSAALASNPDVALAAVVHALALDVFYGSEGGSCLRIDAAPRKFDSVAGSKAFTALEYEHASWGHVLPGHPGDLWTWCLKQDQTMLLVLLASCAARTVNVVVDKSDRTDSARLSHGEDLAVSLGFDMRAWFTPTAANYFGRVSKAQILDALREATGNAPAPAWERMKKSELAVLAERQTEGTGWLPQPLRAVDIADEQQAA